MEKRKRDRQKKRWEDNIKEWTGMDFSSATRAAENRTRWKGGCCVLLFYVHGKHLRSFWDGRWKGIVANSSVVQ